MLLTKAHADPTLANVGSADSCPQVRTKKAATGYIHAHIWLKALRNGKYKSIEALASAANIHSKVVRNRPQLAFLAPAITRQVLDGTQPASMTMNDLTQEVRQNWRDQLAAQI
jgi:hypothetical protein